MIDEFRQRFGKLALPVWLICGLAAFGVFTAGAMRFTPELTRATTDWIVWFLDSFLLLLCLSGGPIAMIAALLLVSMVTFFTRLLG
jgi:hypothetical protein